MKKYYFINDQKKIWKFEHHGVNDPWVDGLWGYPLEFLTVQFGLIKQKRSLLKVCWGAPDLRGMSQLSREWPELVWWLAQTPTYTMNSTLQPPWFLNIMNSTLPEGGLRISVFMTKWSVAQKNAQRIPYLQLLSLIFQLMESMSHKSDQEVPILAPRSLPLGPCPLTHRFFLSSSWDRDISSWWLGSHVPNSGLFSLVIGSGHLSLRPSQCQDHQTFLSCSTFQYEMVLGGGVCGIQMGLEESRNPMEEETSEMNLRG